MNVTFLKIKVGHQLILIPLKQTHLVLPLVELQAIPDKDTALEGILNYHGQALPVYSLALLMDVPQFKYTLDTPLLLCEISRDLIGMVVEEVLEVVNLPQGSIQLPDVNQLMPYVEGIFEDHTWTAWVLNIEKLMMTHKDTGSVKT